MGLDFKHTNGDQVWSDGDYETTPGAWPAMIREMESDYEELEDEITGEPIPYGNRAWSQVERGFDGPEDRQLVERYYREVGDRYTRIGKIEDLEITVDDVSGLEGMGVLVKAFDVQAGLPQEANLKAWAD